MKRKEHRGRKPNTQLREHIMTLYKADNSYQDIADSLKLGIKRDGKYDRQVAYYYVSGYKLRKRKGKSYPLVGKSK